MHYQEILQNYVVNKEKPPLVFIAILANDLHGVTSLLTDYHRRRPDGEKLIWSIAELLNIVNAVHKKVPLEARGSLFKIEQWIGEPI